MSMFVKKKKVKSNLMQPQFKVGYSHLKTENKNTRKNVYKYIHCYAEKILTNGFKCHIQLKKYT